MQGTLVIRADAGRVTGSGHLMRCLALAQVWRERGGKAVFLASPLTEGVERRMADEGFTVEKLPVAVGSAEDARWTRAQAVRRDAAWIVLDGYAFDTEYQLALGGAARPVRSRAL